MREIHTAHSLTYCIVMSLQFLVTGVRVTLANVFDERSFSSPVRALDWKEGLEIAMAATDSQVTVFSTML